MYILTRLRLPHDANSPYIYPDLAIEITGRIRARGDGVKHLCRIHRLLSLEYAHFLLVAHQVEPHFVDVIPAETSVECFTIRGDLVQDEAHPALLVAGRKA